MSKTEKPSAASPGRAGRAPQVTRGSAPGAAKSSKRGSARRGEAAAKRSREPSRSSGPLLNPKHEAFAQAVAEGCSGAQAYRENVSDQCTTASAMVGASRVLADINVALRVQELRMSFREVLEKKIGFKQETAARFLAEVIMTPLSEVTVSSPLCQEWSRVDGEHSSTERIKMPSKLDALDKLNKMAGWYEADKVAVEGVTVVVRIGGQDNAND